MEKPFQISNLFRPDNAFLMAASKRLPYRSYCCESLLFDIVFLGQIHLFEGRVQRPSPFLIRSLPGRERVLRGVRDTSE